MLQYFNKRCFQPSFENNKIPKLVYSCKTEQHHVNMPRAMHMHYNVAEIVFVTEGEGTHIIGDHTYHTGKGDILIYDAQVLHDEISNSDNGLNVYCIGITELQYPGLNPNSLLQAHCKAVYKCIDQYNYLLSIFELIHIINSSTSPFAAETISYLLRALLTMIREIITLNTSHTEPDTEEKICDQIKQYLDLHYTEEISLSSIAKEIHLSPYYISHLFKENEGISPMKYVVRRRIGEAQSLLINSTESVTDIALQVGYRNPNHFHSVFAKIVGLTPKNYRNYWTAGMKELM